MATEYYLVPCCQLNIISHLVYLLFLRSLFLVFKSLIFDISSILCSSNVQISLALANKFSFVQDINASLSCRHFSVLNKNHHVSKFHVI